MKKRRVFSVVDVPECLGLSLTRASTLALDVSRCYGDLLWVGMGCWCELATSMRVYVDSTWPNTCIEREPRKIWPGQAEWTVFCSGKNHQRSPKKRWFKLKVTNHIWLYYMPGGTSCVGKPWMGIVIWYNITTPLGYFSGGDHTKMQDTFFGTPPLMQTWLLKVLQVSFLRGVSSK